MKFKKNILKSISTLLAFIIFFQQIPFSEIKVNAAFKTPKYRELFYTDPFKTKHFNNITDISTIINSPEYRREMASDVSSSYARANKWKTLTKYDHLSPGEIHRRVQDDLWYRYEADKTLNGGELPIKYDKTTTVPDISINGIDVSVPVPSIDISGGAGNDYLQGDHGNDTYIFGKGYDTDTINASSDVNTIIINDKYKKCSQ